MASFGSPVGTIVFQEDVIHVNQTCRSYGSTAKTLKSCATEAEEQLVTQLVLPSIVKIAASESTSPPVPTSSAEAPQTCSPTKPRRHRKRPPRPGRPFLGEVVSNKTLSEIVRVKDVSGGIVCRYDIVEEEHRRVIAEKSTMAKHRREVMKQQAQLQRALVHKRGQRRKQQAESIEADVFVEATALQPEILSTPRSRKPSVLTGFSYGSDDGVQEGLLSSLSSELSSGLSEQNPVGSLCRIKLTRSKQDRMLWVTKARSQQVSDNLQKQVAEARRMEFETLPVEEQKALENAFRLYLEGDSEVASARRKSIFISISNVGLQSVGTLFSCLAELGLVGKDEQEEREIRHLCQSIYSQHHDIDLNVFAFDLVAQARTKLLEMRHDAMSEQFAYYDKDCNGFLDYGECHNMFRKVVRNNDIAESAREEVEQELIKEFNRWKFVDEFDGEHVDFDGFQNLVGRVREKCNSVRMEHLRRIIETSGVTEDLAEAHANELLTLHEIFTEYDISMDRMLDATEVVHAMYGLGLMPHDVEMQRKVDGLVAAAIHSAALHSSVNRLNFNDFLYLVTRVREQCLLTDGDLLKEYFHECDKNCNGRLSFAEASAIFPKLGLTPQCREDQDELKHLLLKVDMDNSGDLDFYEFRVLVQNITERRRLDQLRNANGVARALGFNNHQVSEICEIFFHLDTEGRTTVGIAECRKLLTLLRIDMKGAALQAIIASINQCQQGQIDLEGFFYFLRDISKHMPPGHSLAPMAVVVQNRASSIATSHSAEWDEDVQGCVS